MKKTIQIMGFNILIQKDMEMPTFKIKGKIIPQQTQATLYCKKPTDQIICRVNIAVEIEYEVTDEVEAQIQLDINNGDGNRTIIKENVLHYMYMARTTIHEAGKEQQWYIGFEEIHVYIVQI